MTDETQAPIETEVVAPAPEPTTMYVQAAAPAAPAVANRRGHGPLMWVAMAAAALLIFAAGAHVGFGLSNRFAARGMMGGYGQGTVQNQRGSMMRGYGNGYDNEGGYGMMRGGQRGRGMMNGGGYGRGYGTGSTDTTGSAGTTGTANGCYGYSQGAGIRS